MSSAADVFQAFVDLVKDDPALHSANANTFAKLLSFAEDQENLNVALRVKVLQFIGQSVKFYDAKVCKNVATLAVKIIASDSTEDHAAIAAIKLFPALALVPAENRPDYFVREGADVVIQVILDDVGFSLPVRAAARDALQQLVLANFKSVVTKLIHLISDDRETDDADQVQKERSFAWETLLQLSSNKKEYLSQWTEDVQQHLLQCIGVVLHTVPKDEFGQLIEVASGLSTVRDQQYLPLLDAYLGGCKLDGLRGLEGLAMMAAVIPRGSVVTTLADKLVKEQFVPKMDVKGPASAVQLAQLRVLVFAARTASNDAAPQLMAQVLGLVMTTGIFESSSSCESLAVAEGLLLSLCLLHPKCGGVMLAALSDPALQEKLTSIVHELTELEKQVLFAVKKKVDASTATNEDAAILAALSNLKLLMGPLSKRQMPSLAAFTPSWDKVGKLPEMKRKNVAEAAADQPPRKKAGTESARQGSSNNNSNSKGGAHPQFKKNNQQKGNGPRRR